MDTVAVLSRTNNGLRPVEQALSSANLPFHYLNRAGFFAQVEITSSLAYLGACLYPANYLISQMLRTDLHPTKYLQRSVISSRFKEIKQNDDQVSFWNLMTKEPRTLVEPKGLEALQHFTQFVHSLSRYRDQTASDALRNVLTALRVGEHYSEYETIDNDPIANLQSLLKLAEKYRTIKDFLDFTRRVAAASKSKCGVALSTIHGAKGLEFKKVYVVQCNEGILPHAKSMDLDGERNCFYVACSRAERELIITYSGIPSPFLKGLTDE